jgi:hypothetical protein
MSLQKDEELFKKPLEELKKCLDAWASASRHFRKMSRRIKCFPMTDVVRNLLSLRKNPNDKRL